MTDDGWRMTVDPVTRGSLRSAEGVRRRNKVKVKEEYF
jgi:hypothetical protein